MYLLASKTKQQTIFPGRSSHNKMAVNTALQSTSRVKRYVLGDYYLSF